jgi:hypothetical protein
VPILVECPGCGTKLSAPDSGAGKKVRCPKAGCGTLVPVPMPLPVEEVPVVDAEPAPPPKPRPVKAAAVEDDDDDRPRKRRRDEGEDDDDRPRGRRRDDDDDARPRRRPRRKRSGTNPAVVGLIVLGLIVLIGGGGYGIYMLVAGGTPPPPGWKEHEYKADNFKAYFPKEPRVTSMPNPGRAGGEEFDAIESASVYVSGGFDDPVQVQMIVARFKPGMASSARDKLKTKFREMVDKTGRAGEGKSVRWLGGSGDEFTSSSEVVRIVFTDTGIYAANVRGSKGSRAKPEEEKGFFDNVRLLK